MSLTHSRVAIIFFSYLKKINNAKRKDSRLVIQKKMPDVKHFYSQVGFWEYINSEIIRGEEGVGPFFDENFESLCMSFTCSDCKNENSIAESALPFYALEEAQEFAP